MIRTPSQRGSAVIPNGRALMPKLLRITRNAHVMGGKPCIRGMRVTVGTLVGLVAVIPPKTSSWSIRTWRPPTSLQPFPTPRGVPRRSKSPWAERAVVGHMAVRCPSARRRVGAHLSTLRGEQEGEHRGGTGVCARCSPCLGSDQRRPHLTLGERGATLADGKCRYRSAFAPDSDRRRTSPPARCRQCGAIAKSSDVA